MGIDPSRRRAGRNFAFGGVEKFIVRGRDVSLPVESLDLDGDDGPRRHELRSARGALRGRPGSQPHLARPAARSEQSVGSIARKHLVPPLFVRGQARLQQLGRKQPLDQVVDSPVAVAAHQPKHAGQGERFEDRADLIGWTPEPIDGFSRLDVGGGQRSVALYAIQQLPDQCRVLLERRVRVPCVAQIPTDPVPRQLRGRDQAQAFVVGLVERTLSVQKVVGPLAAVAADARQKGEVVIPAGHVDRIELQRAQAVEDAHDAGRLGG